MKKKLPIGVVGFQIEIHLSKKNRICFSCCTKSDKYEVAEEEKYLYDKWKYCDIDIVDNYDIIDKIFKSIKKKRWKADEDNFGKSNIWNFYRN